MKKIAVSLIAGILAISSMAQKVVYDDNVQKRAVHGFHAIEGSAGIEIIINKGDKEELAVSVGDLSYLDEVRTVVENGVLKINRTDNWKLWNQWKNWKVKVYVSYTNLDAVKATSGSTLTGTDIQLNSLRAHFNSGGIITLTGSVDDLNVDGNSGGQFRGYSLIANVCRASLSSGAGVQVTVNKEISARANSGGFMRFKGDARILDINVNSGGSVKRQN
jgi:hypothetical protein